MQVLLTTIAPRWIRNHLQKLDPGQVPRGLKAGEWILLLELSLHEVVPFPCAVALDELLALGLVELSATPLDRAALVLRARRNPLEHVSRVAIEYTTACGLHCLHCRNAAQAPVTEEDPAKLFLAVDLLVDLGIRRFDFIGGEVSQFGTGWLDVVRHIRRKRDTTVATLTSGWFLERKDFMAAGRLYGNDREFLADLAREGLTHLTFSLDGPEAQHDLWRRTPGLYQRVLKGLAKAREAGLKPQLSTVGDPLPWLAEPARALYPEAAGEPVPALLARLAADDQNYASNLIDVGGAASLRKGRTKLRAIKDEDLNCRGFFRPMPSLRLNAGGEVATCPLMGDAPGVGNLRDRSLAEVLNHMHEAPLFRLHAEKRLAEYRRFLDPAMFPDGVDHICTVRIALNRLALLMQAQGVDPRDAGALRQVNEEVARSMGQPFA